MTPSVIFIGIITKNAVNRNNTQWHEFSGELNFDILVPLFLQRYNYHRGTNNRILTGGSRYDRSQNPCRPFCGGTDLDRCHRFVSLLRGFGAVSYRLRGADPAGPCPVHWRPGAGRCGVPRAGVPYFALWHPGHC